MEDIRQATCPANDELQKFATGDLSAARTDELARHLDHCGRCQQVLESLDGAEPTGGSPASSGVPFADESQCGRAIDGLFREGAGRPVRAELGAPVPRQLGEFELLEPLGEGGMGTVHKARHRSLQTISAIKLLHASHAADPARIERFAREMVALGKLDHPNIVRALDAGEDRGIHYLVMEYVEGVDLGRVLQRQGRLSIADACEVARQAALGLGYVHDHGRVHRDVKPSNLMLDAGGTVKLLDLGLAHVQEYMIEEPAGGSMDDILGSSTPDLTRTHQVMGTLEYMAPEQAAESRSVDKRADIYSLGCTLYTLLTGKSPLATSGSITAVSQLLAHLDRPVPPIDQQREDIPPGLSRLLERMLVKDPSGRPDDAAEVASLLEPFSKGADLQALAGATIGQSERQTVHEAVPTAVAVDDEPAAEPHRAAPTSGLVVAVLAVAAVVSVALLFVAATLGGLWWLSRNRDRVVTLPAPATVPREPQEDVLPEAVGVAPPRPRPPAPVVESPLAEPPAAEPPVAEGPVAEGPPVDLVGLLDPERDIQGETWRLVDRSLISDASRPSLLQFPYRPPHHYRWEATVERLQNNESLQIGLVAGEQPLMLIVDGYPYAGSYTGLYELDNQNVLRQSAAHRGTVLPMNRPVRLRATVQYSDGRADVRLEADGQRIFTWRGLARRLGPGSVIHGHEPSVLCLGNWTAAIKVSDAQVVPLAGGGEVIRFSNRERNGARAAAERVVWKGGRVTYALNEVEAMEHSLLASPDDSPRYLACDPRGLELLTEFVGHEGPIKSVDISPDGEFAASGSGWPQGDNTVRVWNLKTGEAKHVLQGHEAGVMGVAFSPDGSLLASGDLAGRVLLWDVPTGERIRELPNPDGLRHVENLAFTDGGQGIAAAMGPAKSILVWDVASGELAKTIALPANAHGIAAGPEGGWIAAALANGDVELFSTKPAELGERIGRLTGPPLNRPSSYCVTISRDGKLIMAGYKQNTVRIWRRRETENAGDSENDRENDDASRNTERWVVWRDIKTPISGHEAVAFTPDDRYAVVLGLPGGTALLHPATATVVAAEKLLGDGFALALTPDGRAALSAGGTIYRDGGWKTTGSFALHLWQLDYPDRDALVKQSFGINAVPADAMLRVEARRLSEIPESGRIVAVDLQGSPGWRDADMPWLAGLNDLAELQLDGTLISEQGILSLGPLPQLRSLDLSRTAVGDPVGDSLPSQFPSLQRLVLDGTGAGDSTFPIVAQLKSLQIFRLAATPVTDQGLAQFPKLPQLEELSLERTAVTEQGLAALAAQPNLLRLGLSGTRVRGLDGLTREKFPALSEVTLLDAPAEETQLEQARTRLAGADLLSGRGPTDLLRLVDPRRDSIKAKWTLEEQGLKVPEAEPAVLGIPVLLPNEFDLQVVMRRLSGPAGMVFALPMADGTEVPIGLDQWNSDLRDYVAVVHGIDGKMMEASPVVKRVRTFDKESYEPVVIDIRVRREGAQIMIAVDRNGDELLAWRGEADRLQPKPWWSSGDGRLTITQFRSRMLIEAMTVRPINGRLHLPAVAPDHGDPDFEVANRVLSLGGTLKLTFGDSGEAPFTVRDASQLPQRPFWIERIEVQDVDLSAGWFQQIAELDHLDHLLIKNTRFDNADLAPLAPLQSLRRVDAWRSSLDDTGVAVFSGLSRLEELRIGETAVTDAGIAGLADHPALRTLMLERCSISGRGLEAVATIPHLQTLSLAGTDLTGEELALLKDMESLEALVIAACDRLVVDDLKQLAEFPALLKLSARAIGLGPEASETLARISKLERLELSENPLGDSGLLPLVRLASLRELIVNDCRLSDEGLAALAFYPRLQKLELQRNPQITDRAVPGLGELRGLTELHVQQTGVTAAGVEQLRGLLPGCQIFWRKRDAAPLNLDFTGQSVTDETLPGELAGKRPTRLSLEGPGITDASMPLIASLPDLFDLILWQTSVTDEGLATLRESGSLKRVALWNMSQITERAVPHLAAIPNLRAATFKGTGIHGPGLDPLYGKLRSLYIGSPRLDTEAFARHIVPFDKLHGLDLAGSRIGDDAVQLMCEQMHVSGYLHLGFNPNMKGPGLAHIKHMPDIERLVLDGSGIDDEGFAHLRDAKDLEALVVRSTALTDASLDTLLTLSGLNELDVSGTRISEEGVRRLEQAFPQARIVATHLDDGAGEPPANPTEANP